MESDIKCPKCGTEWALENHELAQPSFTCPECGTIISLGEPDSGQKRATTFKWQCFLPSTPSMLAFILVMLAYDLATQSIVVGIMSPFVGVGDLKSSAQSWGYFIFSIITLVVWFPIWQTLVFIAIFETLRAIGFSAAIQALISALLLSTFDGYRWWPHAIYSLPGFLIMGFSYLYWRTISWRIGLFVVLAIHSLFNGIAEIRPFMNLVHEEIVSSWLSGDALNWNRADKIDENARDLGRARRYREQTEMLQRAIDIYSYDPQYYVDLGTALLHLGNLADAEGAFRKAIFLDEHKWEAWDGLSLVLCGEHHLREAMDAEHHALIVSPQDKRLEIEARINSIASGVKDISSDKP